MFVPGGGGGVGVLVAGGGLELPPPPQVPAPEMVAAHAVVPVSVLPGLACAVILISVPTASLTVPAEAATGAPLPIATK